MYSVRKMKKHEQYFFLEMFYESIYIPENKPSMEKLLSEPNLRKYTETWGRPGDEVLVAVNERDDLVGAVWYRLFAKDEQSYGFVDEYTPELGMAIKEEVRGQGVGTLLMAEIILLAKPKYTALSLSVDPENKAAVKLYKKFGFKEEGLSGTSITMMCYVNEAYEVIKELESPSYNKQKEEQKSKPIS